jgi:hypothetical protein
MANETNKNGSGKGGDNRTAGDVDGNRSGDPGNKTGGGKGVDQSDDKGNANKGDEKDASDVLPPTPPQPLPRR